MRALRNSQMCYLTFDDGPSRQVTGQLLEALDSNGVKATFFLSGQNVARNPDLVLKIIEHGHIIGEHGFSHLHAWKTGPIRSFLDAVNGEKSIKRATRSIGTELFRPPYGKFNIGNLLYILTKRKVLILWNVDSKDYKPQSAEDIINRIKDQIIPGKVFLFHDGSPDGEPKGKNTSEVVRKIAEHEYPGNLKFGTLAGFSSAGFGLGRWEHW